MFENVEKLTRSCTCGKVHSLLTDECVVSREAEAQMQSYLKKRGLTRPMIVCDENTRRFTDLLLEQVPASLYAVDGCAHATEEYTAEVNSAIERSLPDVLIACGSGSVHDIVRYCAYEKKLPFVSYPTAASVDGFVSGVAAMTWYGQKLTFPSAPPIAVFANPAVYCTAPERLTASGVGDVIGKVNSLFDWKVAHALTGEYYCPEIAELEYDAVRDLTDAVHARAELSAEEYTTKVMNGLLLSGLAMQLAGNSRPASGAEHHLSHLWEMHRINEETDALHGEKVAVGLLLVVRCYQKALADGIDFDRLRAISLERVFDRETLVPVFGDLIDATMRENLPDGTVASSSLAGLKLNGENAILGALEDAYRMLPDADELEALLKAANVPVTTREVGLPSDDAFLERSLRYAPYVRNRLTLLKVLEAAEQ